MQELAAAKRHLAEQEEVTCQITEANVRLQQEKGQLQQQVEQHRTQSERLHHDYSQLQQDKRQIQRQKDQLQGQNNQLQQEKDQLQQEKIQLENEKGQLCAQLAMTTGPSTATGGNAILQRRLREAEARLEEYESGLIISEEEVQLTGPRLGGGAFGGQVHLSFCLTMFIMQCYSLEVFAAVWRGVPVAVKRFHKSLVTDHIVELIRQEIFICSRVHHPNIVSICGAITAGGIPLHLVMELLEASLTEVMAASRSAGRYLSFREQIDLSVDCLCGMLYLHELQPPLLHGDIRPTNILVTTVMEAKIGDLGTAHVMGGSLSCGPVSLDYLAPERMPRSNNTAIHNTKEADVCSLGVTLAEIFTAQQASRRIRQKQISLVAHQLLQDVCCAMTEEAAKDRIPVAAALAQVRPLKEEDKYTRCPVKRMVKGKLHDPNGPILVDKRWQ